MTGAVDGHELGAWNEPGIGGGIVLGDEPILCAADQQRRPVDHVQPVPELGIVHVGLPGDERERLAVARARQQLGIGKLAGVRPPFVRIGIQQAVDLILRHGVDVGNVELIDRPDLDADRRDQHQLVDRRRVLGRNLGCGPAADRMADQHDSGQFQSCDQFEIEVREVVDRVDPDRQARSAEAWMHRRDHVEPLAERGEERRGRIKSAAAVQEQQRRPAATLVQLDLDLAELQGLAPETRSHACVVHNNLSRCSWI